VWQRGTSVTGAGGGVYTADRWFLYAGGQATVSRQATGDTTNLPNIQYCARVQRNNGSSDTTGIPFAQAFETVNSIPFAGKTVTISYYARKGANYSSASSILYSYLYTGTGTDQNYLAVGYTGSANPIAGQATLTTTWQRFTFTGTLASTATEIALNFSFAPTGTAGAADYFEVTGVQMDVGSVALPFRTYAGTLQGELAACQRYYNRTTLPSGAATMGQGFGYNTTSTLQTIIHPVPLRVAATAIDYNALQITDGQTNYTSFTNFTINQGSTFNTTIYGIGFSGLTQFRFYEVRATGSTSYIGLSAEL
jgi:hypothetical protein